MSIIYQTTTEGYTALAAAYRGGGTKISFKRGILASTVYLRQASPSLYSINGVITEVRLGRNSVELDCYFSAGAGKIKSILISGLYSSQSTSAPILQVASTEGIEIVPAQTPTVYQTTTLSFICPGANQYFSTETVVN